MANGGIALSDGQAEHKGKKHKPGPNHPWKKAASNEVLKWAKEQTNNTHINNWKKGGGHDPWNK